MFKNILSRKIVDLFSLMFQNIPNNTNSTFLEVGGVAQPNFLSKA